MTIALKEICIFNEIAINILILFFTFRNVYGIRKRIDT